MNRIERSPAHVPPQTSWLVFLCTLRKILGEGVKSVGSSGSRVMVGRKVGVKVGTTVLVTSGVPVSGLEVGPSVLRANKSGVLLGCRGGRENGVAVGWGGAAGAGVCKKGMEIGSPLQPARRSISNVNNKDLFIRPLPNSISVYGSH
jgi:hypothetical protein